MKTPQVTHLIDDETPGGVTRMLSHLTEHPEVTAQTKQSIKLLSTKKLRGLPPIEGDVIVSHLPFNWRALPTLFALRATNADKKLIHIEHHYTRAFTSLNVPNKKRFFSMLRIAYSLFDCVIAVSQDQQEWLEARQLVRPERLCMIHPSVDLTPFTQVPPLGTPPKVFGAIGRLERQKGFDLLIEAFQSQQDLDAKLLIYGEGSERATLQSLAKGDPRIAFRGHAPCPKVAYESVDVVVMPSRWEAYGIVADEALSASRPVLASSVDGLKDRIQSGRASKIELNPASISRALRTALQGPPNHPLVPLPKPSMAPWIDAFMAQ